MGFSMLPEHVKFGDLVFEWMAAFPYSGPNYPPLEDNGIRTRLLGVALPDGTFVVDANPKAEWFAAYSAWEWAAVKSVIDCAMSLGKGAVLLSDDPTLPEKHIQTDALQYVDPSRLKHGIFSTLDYRLGSLKAYDLAAIWVDAETAAAFRKALPSATLPSAALLGGRPKHPAFAWYEERGFDRRGLSMKELQREMKRATGRKWPGESTIRSWENDFQGKPPTETPTET